MANPSFWYYPADGGGLVEVQLPRPLSERTVTPLRDRRSGWTGSGSMKSAVNSGRLRVSLSMGPFNDTGVYVDLVWQLRTMMSHLERGQPVSFAVDRDKAVCANLYTYGTGNVAIGHDVSPFPASYNTSAALADDDVVCIESPNPEGHREYHKLTGYSSSTGTGSIAGIAGVFIYYGSTETPVLIRHVDFWPVLVLPPDQLGRDICVGDHDQTFTLDVTLEQDIGGQFALFASDSADAATGIGPPVRLGKLAPGVGVSLASGYSLQEAIAERVGGGISGPASHTNVYPGA